MSYEVKTLTFYSNYFNHHQKALCDEFYKLLGDGFTFVETMPIEGFRANMGWGEKELPDYVIRTYESEEIHKQALKLGMESDVVLMGTAPEIYIEERLDNNKLTLRYSERPLKEGFIKFFIPRLTKKYLHLHVRNRKKHIYILGASAYTSLDYHKMFKSYEHKCYKFGYFPVHKEYDIDALMSRKEELSNGENTILWLGRMLRLKRPDLLVEAAKMLKDKGYSFRLTLVGEGEERPRLEAMVKKYGLEKITEFKDFLSPDEARECMADHKIYVMTSNFYEGWGSVIYEGLNAGCAVVASHACGATPWLVKNEETGLVFKSGSAKSLSKQLEKLLVKPELQKKYGMNAYNNMHAQWNPEVAAKRVIALSVELMKKPDDIANIYNDGPCSYAEYLKNNWFTD